MKSCCGCLGQVFVNFSVVCSMWVLCTLWSTMKSCVSLCHHLKQEQCCYRKCVVIFYTVERLRWLLSNFGGDICTIQKILVVGIKVSLPSVKYLCHFCFFVNIGFKGLCLNIHFFT